MEWKNNNLQYARIKGVRFLCLFSLCVYGLSAWGRGDGVSFWHFDCIFMNDLLFVIFSDVGGCG